MSNPRSVISKSGRAALFGKKYKVPKLHSQLRVNSDKNSTCYSAKLSDLNWNEWWTDYGFSGIDFYLHVAHKNGETSHRVYCKGRYINGIVKARLKFKDGILYWLVDKKQSDKNEFEFK